MLTTLKKDNTPAAVDIIRIEARLWKYIHRLDHAGDNKTRPRNARKRGMGKQNHGKGTGKAKGAK